MEPVLRAAVLFLFSLPRSAGKKLQAPALCISRHGGGSRCRHVPDSAEEIKGYWYVNPIARFPDFILGMLLFRLYEYLKNRNITTLQGNIMEFVSVAVFMFFYLYAAEIPKVYRYSCYYWLPVAMVIVSFALQKGALSRLLNSRLMVAGGEISYGFYLIHLFVLLSYAEWQKTAEFKVEWYYSVPLLFAVVILLSLLSYRYFEKPLNRKIKLLLNE